MSETPPDPETHTASATPSKRPRTLLGRLAVAVREQNWFAVVLEMLIVIVGVVIGFQVTGWGQARADRSSEQTYLRQLAADLRETERRTVEVDSVSLQFEHASGALMRSFYAPVPPPRDSLIARIWQSGGSYGVVRAVTGTAEALVATGDLSLIRNDSLRAALTAYLKTIVQGDEEQGFLMHRLYETTVTVRTLDDGAEEWRFLMDSFLAESDPLTPLPGGPLRRLAPLDPEAFLSDLTVLMSVREMIATRLNLRIWRASLREETVALLEQVEAELDD